MRESMTDSSSLRPVPLAVTVPERGRITPEFYKVNSFVEEKQGHVSLTLKVSKSPTTFDSYPGIYAPQVKITILQCHTVQIMI